MTFVAYRAMRADLRNKMLHKHRWILRDFLHCKYTIYEQSLVSVLSVYPILHSPSVRVSCSSAPKTCRISLFPSECLHLFHRPKTFHSGASAAPPSQPECVIRPLSHSDERRCACTSFPFESERRCNVPSSFLHPGTLEFVMFEAFPSSRIPLFYRL